MTYTLRPFDDDYAPVALLLNLLSLEPVTPAALAEADQHLPAGTIRQRLVAVGTDGQVIGYGAARRYPYEQEGPIALTVCVDPARRGQGIGSALAAAARAFARAHGATCHRTTVRDDDPASLAYARRRGYTQERHLCRSTLDVTSFDDAAFAHVVQTVIAGGIRFATLADEPGEATEWALYELDRHASGDNPGEALPDFMPFPEWRQQALGRPEVRPDLVIFARDGERIVGMSDMALTGDVITTGFTGVHRDYRGRSIALALKVLAVQAARRYGVTCMRTENEAANAPMLAINRRLGYRPAPGLLTLRRAVDQRTMDAAALQYVIETGSVWEQWQVRRLQGENVALPAERAQGQNPDGTWPTRFEGCGPAFTVEAMAVRTHFGRWG